MDISTFFTFDLYLCHILCIMKNRKKISEQSEELLGLIEDSSQFVRKTRFYNSRSLFTPIHHSTRIVGFALLTGLFLLQGLSATPEASSSPNILFLLADDVGLDGAVGYDIGEEKPNMPHLTSLMDEGLTFDNAYACPLCAPTRASFLTGQYGFRTGVVDVSRTSILDNQETIVQSYMGETSPYSYSSALIGKWHVSRNSNDPENMGIDYFAGIMGGGVEDYYQWTLTEDGKESTSHEYATAKLTDLAIEWIDSQEGPWFCTMAYNSPHTPIHLPPESTYTIEGLSGTESDIKNNPIPYYLAMMENLDYEIGRLLDSLTEEERANTIIVYMGDNGTEKIVVQEPFTRQKSKGSLYEGGIAVPLVVAGSGVSRTGERDSSLISVVDLFSTFSQMAGASESRYEDSISFLPLLSQEGTGEREFVYSDLNSVHRQTKAVTEGYSIRDSHYKLILSESLGVVTEKLYDLLSDPFEEQDLLKRGEDQLNDDQKEALSHLKDQAESIRG